MPLDPQVNTILEMMSVGDAPIDFDSMTPEEMRASANLPQPENPEPVGRVEDRAIAGPGGEIPLRIYHPEGPDGERPRPLMVFFHGGGFVLGDLNTHDSLCRRLCNRLAMNVVAVDYRLAPEHKFPAAPDDCYAALEWAVSHAESLGSVGERVFLCGDSAGGNLAAAMCQRARDSGGPAIAGQILIYPTTDLNGGMPSHRENAEGYMLTTGAMRRFVHWYLNEPSERDDPRASPLRAADFAGLPPAFILTAEYDPLRDEGEAYAEKLRAAGVAVWLKRYDGMIHGFVNFLGIVDRADQSIQDIAEALNAAVR